MNTTKYRPFKAGAIVAVVAVAGMLIAGVSFAQHDHSTHANMQTADSTKAAEKTPSLQMIHSTRLPAVQDALDRAIGHIEAGRQEAALKEMKQIKLSLAAIHQTLGRHVGPQFVNDRCPIMGGKFNPEKISAELTRMHGEQKVGFCCAGCPAQWDRLTEAQKIARLKKVAADSQPAMQHQH